MLYLNLLYITLICVIVIDLSGIITSLKCGIAKLLDVKNPDIINLKPFSCSFCMNFWLSLIYLIITSTLSLQNLTIVLLLSFFTTVFKDILLLLKDIFITIIEKIEQLI